jgi:hypothetical protein
MRIVGAIHHSSTQVRVRIFDRVPPAARRRERRLNNVAGFLAIADEQIGEPNERSRERSVDLLDLR